MSRKTLFVILKYLIAAALLALVLSRVDTRAMLALLEQAEPLYIIGAFIAFQCSQVMSAYRMRYYYHRFGHRLELGLIMVLNYVSMIYNVLVPGGIGGDAYRVYFLRQHYGIRAKEGIRVQLCNRASGLAAMLLLMLGLLLMVPSPLPIFIQFAVVLFLGLMMLWVYVWGVKRFLKENFAMAMQALKYSLGVQLFAVFSMLLLIFAFGYTDFIPEWLLLFLVASIAGMIPITIGGLGIREFVFFSGAHLLSVVYGKTVTPEIGVTLSLAYFGLTLLTALLSIPLEPYLKRRWGGLAIDSGTPPPAPPLA